MARLFLAVWPPSVFVERLDSLPRAEGPGVRWVAPENWHVTLRFLGDTEPADVQPRLDGTPLPAATATLGPVVSRLGRRLVVVPVAGLDELAAVVAAATADVGSTDGTRGYSGHLTLGRLRAATRSTLIGTPIHAEAPVDEVVLVESRLSHEGASYQVVARWPTEP